MCCRAGVLSAPAAEDLVDARNAQDRLGHAVRRGPPAQEKNFATRTSAKNPMPTTAATMIAAQSFGGPDT